MPTTVQHSVYLINKPGVLAQVLHAIAEAKVNIVALTIVDSHEHGVLRVVGNDPQKLGPVLRQLNLPLHETHVLVVELPNRPGALVSIVSQLAEEHINIEYAYVTAGAGGGKTTGIIKVDNLVKAAKVLKITPAPGNTGISGNHDNHGNSRNSDHSAIRSRGPRSR